jgi:hypothetical protein
MSNGSRALGVGVGVHRYVAVWFGSVHIWESEFIAVAAIIRLSVFLR